MKFTKFCLALIFLLSMAAFGLSVVLFAVRENEKEKRIHLEAVNAELRGRIETLEGEKSELESRVKSLSADLDATRSALDQSRASVTSLGHQLDDAKKNLEISSAQADELNQALKLSEDRNRDLENTLDRLELQMGELQLGMPSAGGGTTIGGQETVGNNAAAQPIALELKTGGERSAGVAEGAAKTQAVGGQTLGAALPGAVQEDPADKSETAASEALQAGRILLVNRKFNFVIVNMGSKQGLKMGDQFLVSEGGDKIAKVQVEKLYDDYAAAKITEMTGDPLLLKEGNLVMRG